MKTKKQVEERIVELRVFLEKNKGEFYKAQKMMDIDKMTHHSVMIKVLEQKIEVLKWTLS